MAFVNEFIPDSDIERYGIKELDKKYNKGHYKPDWTVDREQNIYLRYFRNDREEHSNRRTFFFYWKHVLMLITVDLVASSGQRDSAQMTEYKLFKASIPESIFQHRAEILSDFREALTAWKGGGIYSTASEYFLQFDF
jgi:hypothetical protein